MSPVPKKHDERELRWREPSVEFSTRSLLPRWTRFCWWLSRKLGGRTVFGKRDET